MERPYVSSIISKYGDTDNVQRDVETLNEIFARQGASLLIDAIAESVAKVLIQTCTNPDEVKRATDSIVGELSEAIGESNLKHPHGPWTVIMSETANEAPDTARIKNANAQLTTAAPEMLEALERITKLIETDNLIEQHGRLMGSYLEACQAIAKARGQS